MNVNLLQKTFLFLMICFFSNSYLNAENVLYSEDFNACTMPTGWLTGLNGTPAVWEIGTPNNPEAGGTSIDGTCMAYFDDNVLGADILPGTVRLTSPVIDASAYSSIILNLDVHFRSHDINATYLEIVLVNTVALTIQEQVTIYRQDVSGSLYSSFVSEEIDVSQFSGGSFQIAFGFNDGNGQSWWAGIDNLVVTGAGSISCANAETITVDGGCLSANNRTNAFEGALPACNDNTSSAIWYNFAAPASGTATIKTNARYNDLLTVFSGNCNSMVELTCTDADLYGFEGEKLMLTGLTPSANYLIRVSGVSGTFGATQGDFCIEVVDGGNVFFPPTNDLCSNAVPLTIDANCTEGHNYYATFDGPIPSLNNRSDASIWYSFMAPNSGEVIIHSGADFADVITVFNGSCGSLTEVGGTDFGQNLTLTGLTTNMTYYIQVTSFFNSINGEVCMQITTPPTAPNNDLCGNATHINIGETCTTGTNTLSGFEGVSTSCVVKPQHSIWYSFNAPASGRTKMKTGADFPHVVSVFSGTCGTMTEQGCYLNPDRCGEAVAFNNLVPGALYYVQIASAENPFGYIQGDVCLQILDNENPPIKLKVKAFLEGMYDTNTGSMSTDLSIGGYVPFDQPYNRTPWNYEGNECSAFIPSTVVDWVLIELRDATDKDVIVASKASLLLADGTIADGGRDGVLFDGIVENGQYYVVLRHRNHLAVLSSTLVTLPNEDTYDFSLDASLASGTAQMKDMGDGSFALIGGDFTGDGVITVLDFNLYSTQASLLNTYISGDINGDQSVTVADFNLYQINSSIIGVEEIRY